MTARRLSALLLVTALLVLVTGCAGPSGQASSGESTSVAEPSGGTPATPTVESLKGVSLAVKEETLVFDYLRAGKLPALESRFGKPTRTYRTAGDEASTGFAELADGRTYQVQCGLDERAVAVVMTHGVAAKQGQSQTAADTAFLKAMVDGTTTLALANAYLKGTGAATVRLAVMDPKGLNVPAHVWALPDGSGFIVADFSALTAEQMAALDVEVSVPYQALYWTAARWRAY